jgi:hypothetical protein
MAQIPNPYADQTTESLIRRELGKGNIPLVCDKDGCSAVSSVSPAVALRDRDAAHNVLGSHESCGGSFVVADLTKPLD